MKLYKYIAGNGLMMLDFLIRKKSLKIVYKGKSAFVYPV
jgi:hypothetical protein